MIANLPINPLMDPPNHAFWDDQQRQYVAYLRGWIHHRIRSIRRCTSKDFLNWSAPEYIDMGSKIEHLYTNMATPYERAPGIYFMFAKRFVPWRKFFNDWPYYGLSEIVLLASRDGMRFHRTFMEPFVRPGLDPLNWHERAMIMGKGILQTSPTEMSLYHFEHYRTKAVRLRRDVVRPDGFTSVHAPYQEESSRPSRWCSRERPWRSTTSPPWPAVSESRYRMPPAILFRGIDLKTRRRSSATNWIAASLGASIARSECKDSIAIWQERRICLLSPTNPFGSGS